MNGMDRPDDGQLARHPGWKPEGFLRHDCDTNGCFNKLYRPALEWVNDALPDKIRFSDVDAMVELHGYFLYFEMKSHGKEMEYGQLLALKRQTIFGPGTVLILYGDPRTMALSKMQTIIRGKVSDPFDATLDDLIDWIKEWCSEAMKAPLPAECQRPDGFKCL